MAKYIFPLSGTGNHRIGLKKGGEQNNIMMKTVVRITIANNIYCVFVTCTKLSTLWVLTTFIPTITLWGIYRDISPLYTHIHTHILYIGTVSIEILSNSSKLTQIVCIINLSGHHKHVQCTYAQEGISPYISL